MQNYASLFVLVSAVFPGNVSASSGIHDYQVVDIDGNEVSLSAYKGKAVLLVNVASKCGFTYQYEALEAVYKKYSEQGLVVIGFPSNDFLGQEPGSNEEIKEFCQAYFVTFPLFSKIKVKGKNKHPLYQYLTSRETNPNFGGRITWNFNKFLIDQQGRVVNRFGSTAEPDAPEVISAIESVLDLR